MKINSFQHLLLIGILLNLIPTSTFAITFTIKSCKDSPSDISLLYDQSSLGMKDTLEPNNLSFNDQKSQAKAIRKVRHEHYLASREEKKKIKKDNFGLVLVIVAVIFLGIFTYLGYAVCASVD